MTQTVDIPGARAWGRARRQRERDVDRHRAAMRRRDDAIVRAMALGFTGPQIAGEFGITKERVYQIIAERQVRERAAS